MARDDAAREHETESKLLDRRSYLKLTGAAAASVAAAGASGSAEAAEYDTIKVPANTRKVIRVGAGETFENKLIDITADGAHVKLLTEGSGWTVRNVGVKGENNNMDGTYGCFYLRCTDGGEAVAENIYMGDGAADRCGHAAVSDWDNSGTVTIRNINVTGWSADGMYMSHAGANPSSQGGITQVENAFLKNNNIENCRLGTSGSYIKDSVIHVEGEHAVPSNESGQKNPRGLWFKEQGGLKAINCDIKVNDTYAVFANDNGSGTLEDCRVEGQISSGVTKNNVSGNPDLTPPEGVPMTAEEAASGNVSSSSGSDTTTSDGSEDTSTDDGQGTLLELVSGDNTSSAQYEFTVEGSVQKRTSGDGYVSESGDKIAENDDGTVTVSGVAGNGYGDAFYVDGIVTSMSLDESKWTLRYDGQEASVQDIALPNTLVIDGSDSPRASSSYTFAVSGRAEKSAVLGSIQDNDEVSGGEITGQVYGGVDGYRFSGEITGFSLDGPANVRVEDDA